MRKEDLWSENTEVESIQRFDIGIMPLEDSAWERGKCGYKLTQYMACTLPVVASPVGMNKEIVEDQINGLWASKHPEWLEALLTLKNDRELRIRMGLAGRFKVAENYDIRVTGPRLVDLLKNAADAVIQ